MHLELLSSPQHPAWFQESECLPIQVGIPTTELLPCTYSGRLVHRCVWKVGTLVLWTHHMSNIRLCAHIWQDEDTHHLLILNAVTP